MAPPGRIRGGLSTSRVSPPAPLSISYGHVGCLKARAFPPPVRTRPLSGGETRLVGLGVRVQRDDQRERLVPARLARVHRRRARHRHALAALPAARDGEGDTVRETVRETARGAQ
jgi:hypothetical protein